MRDADRGVGRIPDRGLGVEGDPQPGRRDHVEVVGAVAHRDRLAERGARRGREAPQRERLSGPVHDRTGQPPGEPAIGDLQRVGGRVVDAEPGGEPVGELREAAADNPAPVAEPLERPDQRPRARRQPQLRPDGIDRGRVESGQQGHALPQGGGEVQLAAHRRLGHRGDLLGAARPGREQVDDLAPDQGGVDIKHDQAHRAPVQAAALHGHVRPLVQGLPGQGGPQPVRISPGYLELDAGHRPVREPSDPVDVGAAGRDPAGDGGDGRGRQRAAEHRDVQAAAAPGRLAGAGGDLQVQVQVRGHGGHLAVNRGQVRRIVAGQQDAQHQPAADHYLLDVDDVQLVPGEHGE